MIMSKHSPRAMHLLTAATIILGLLSYLPLPARNGSFAAAAKTVAASPATASSSLQGAQAVRQLKEQGLYDSLQAAFAAARSELHAVTFDSTFTQEAKLITSDVVDNSHFGSPVAISGDTAVVGAPFTRAAYVFVRNGTNWSLQQKLMPGDRTIEYFGHAVDISGNTIVVGAYDLAASSATGSAYVFSRYRSFWEQSHKLTANDSVSFGNAVAISGDTIVVGAPDVAGINPGAVYVFSRSSYFPTVYVQQKLMASDEAAGADFGWSVDINGATMVVGAPRDERGRGSAYVFVRNGSVWSAQEKLTANDGVANDRFGYSVAVAANTIVVGASYDDIGPYGFAKSHQGSAYVFVRSNGSWSQQQKLIASDGVADDRFGYSVAVAGNTIVVGAPSFSHSNSTEGSAYVFVRDSTTWSQQQKLTASDLTPNDDFGVAVAINADTILVGVDGIGPDGAYVFVKPYSPGCPCTPAEP
jgi:hypothetical protein